MRSVPTATAHSTRLSNRIFPFDRAATIALCLVVGGFASPLSADELPRLNVDKYDRACDVRIDQQKSLIAVSWQLDDQRRARITIDLDEDRPLVRSIAVAGGADRPFRSIWEGLDPMLLIRTGRRDLDKRDGWTIFFDRMQNKPSVVHLATIGRTGVSASSHARRATLTIGPVSAGPFEGELRWTFFAGSPLVLQEAVVQTGAEGTAFLYDVGLVFSHESPQRLSWRDAAGKPTTIEAETAQKAQHLAVSGRAVAAESAAGSIALFPPPHRYFYPLDFSDNLKNVWIGPGYAERPLPFGFGIRHDPTGDNRFVPWFNAPPGTSQELGLFMLISDQSAERTLESVAAFTRSDRFEPLTGHRVFSSHYHVEHTRELLEAQEPSTATTDLPERTGKTPSGKTYRIPDRLENPGFVRVFRKMGIDVVHLAEFHFGRTPKMTTEERVQHLELLHAECRRLSDEEFLLLPGEEPNVHLGGHWISFFPKPVYWVLNRPAETPWVSEHAQLGSVYHVGSESDVLRLLRNEGGLAWTAHPRIKGSTGYPDRYRDRIFFTSDRFLGAAWKAMPADLSLPRLGTRVLDLFDDMSNWGDPKYVLGEVDVFKIEPDHELYGHMNVNYLRLEEIPRFDQGWQPVLDAIRGGRFFVTTGEVLIPEFKVNGRRSGEVALLPEEGSSRVRLDLKWTFPLEYAVIVAGDGQGTTRQRIDLSHTDSFGEESLTIDADLAGQKWVRVEVWDVATNGAFTQPVGLSRP